LNALPTTQSLKIGLTAFTTRIRIMIPTIELANPPSAKNNKPKKLTITLIRSTICEMLSRSEVPLVIPMLLPHFYLYTLPSTQSLNIGLTACMTRIKIMIPTIELANPPSAKNNKPKKLTITLIRSTISEIFKASAVPADTPILFSPVYY